MLYNLISLLMWLIAALLISFSMRAVRRQLRLADEQPHLAFRDAIAALALVVQLAIAGGLVGFGLAMLLDRLIGGWGILLAAVMCCALAATVYRGLRLQREGESA
jgi:hypothetical protein